MKIILLLSLFISTKAWSIDSNQIIAEYERLKAWAQQVEPDGVVGGLYPYVQADGYKILFSKDFNGRHEQIRFFLNGTDGEKDFAITYIKSIYIVKGQTVLRRFYGPEPTGWRMDEVDYYSSQLLQSQGTKTPRLNDKAKEILKTWEIEID